MDAHKTAKAENIDDETRRERARVLARVEALIDDSLLFLSNELARLRIGESEVAMILERAKTGPLAKWAERCLTFYEAQNTEWPRVIEAADINDFLRRKLGLNRPGDSRPAPGPSHEGYWTARSPKLQQ